MMPGVLFGNFSISCGSHSVRIAVCLVGRNVNESWPTMSLPFSNKSIYLYEDYHPCHQPQHGKILSSEVKYVLLVLRACMYRSLSLSAVFVFSKGTSIVLRLKLTCMVKTNAVLKLKYGICFTMCICLCLSAAFVHSTWQ